MTDKQNKICATMPCGNDMQVKISLIKAAQQCLISIMDYKQSMLLASNVAIEKLYESSKSYK